MSPFVRADYEAHATPWPDNFEVMSRVALVRHPTGAQLFLSQHGETSAGVPVATGLLEPGDYVFHADYTSRINFGARDLSYAASLDLPPPEPAPTPIPLPPAAWSAVVTAATFAGASSLRRRGRRRL